MLRIFRQPGERLYAVRFSAALFAAIIVLLAGCTTAPTTDQRPDEGTLVCDSYLILQMCVRDLVGDGVVDMIYFSDTYEIFMYREGMQDAVAKVMPLHRCAVPLSEGMQAITNKILNRVNLSLSEELSIMKDLLSNYLAARPEIEACNARFDAMDEEAEEPVDDFFIEESEWDDL